MSKEFTLQKSARLKSRKALEALFQNGHRFSHAPFRVFYDFTETQTLKFGVGVSNRNFKKAVDRNKIKRRVREAYRLQKNELQESVKLQPKGMNVFFIYTLHEMLEYADIYKAMEKILKKLGQKFLESHS